MGSYYGASLAQSGQSVHFLLRSDYEAVRRNGVQVLSPRGNFRVRPVCARDPAEIGICDLVLIALKTTANREFSALLRPLAGPGTVFLTLQNGLTNEEQIATLFSPTQVMGGLCFVCLNRIEPGVIRHIDHGRVVLGEFQGWPEPRTHDIATLFKNAGVPCSVAANLARAHWEKLAWNIPFNGLGVAGVVGLEAFRRGEVPPPSASLGECLTTDRLLMDPGWEAMAKTLIQEVVSVANRLGFDLSPSLVEVQIERTRSMGAYKASTLIDFERGQPLELQSIFLEPLAQARHAGVDTPWLQTLCKVLEGLDRRRVEAP